MQGEDCHKLYYCIPIFTATGEHMTTQYFCTCCGRKLNPETMVTLELDTRTNRYTYQPVPEEHSQGCFEFGLACAKREAKAAREASK